MRPDTNTIGKINISKNFEYFTAIHADYHQPGDEVSKIDFVKYEKITRTVYATMWEIAELKTRLKVDKPLAASGPTM